MKQSEIIWQESEKAALRLYYPSAAKATVMGALPRHSWHAISCQASELCVPRNQFWNAANVKLMRSHYPTNGPAALGRLLGINASLVAKKALRMGLRFGKVRAESVAPGGGDLLPPVKRSPRTPVFNAQKAGQQIKNKVNVPITAEEARKLKPYTKEWWAYADGGWRGWQTFMAQPVAA